ncbi:dTDP-4-dehydrorhamnose reductase [Candidatus Peregrinibacteria bacterium HGW-Peregrinibacteria-1]|jgi:dTDP-4-dehydrorhamnose reductase|nr:MAG: dTDP-4-dehydrorhamnose reductase [Candidatus Peregrinibacteria bacterium HGW-Peregrinibacteria-1]
MKKILITGGSGMLGQEFAAALSGYDVASLGREELDLTVRESVLGKVGELSPDFVINCAAYTDVDGSEDQPQLAFDINAKAVGYLADACEKVGAVLIHFSTDYVFDGEKEDGYDETDVPSPINVYGESKLHGEIAALQNCSSAYVIRTSWLYADHGKNFKQTMLRLADERNEVRVVADQVGCPTDVKLVVEWVEKHVLSRDVVLEYGVYHVAGDKAMSWAEFAREIFKNHGKDVAVLDISAEEFGAKAKRPRVSILRSVKLNNK